MEKKPTIKDPGLDVQKLLNKALMHWYFIVASVMVGLLGAFLVNRYTIPQFEVQSTVMISKPVDEGASAAAILYGSEVFKGSKSLSNEIMLLKTKALALKTLQQLDFGISYYQQGNVKLTETYNTSPIHVVVDSATVNFPYGVLLKVNFLNSKSYQISTENPGWQPVFARKAFTVGKTYDVNGFRFTVTSKDDGLASYQNEILFTVNDPEQLAGYYASALAVNPLPGGASVMAMSLSGPTPAKDMAFLNAHMRTYDENNLAIKNTNAVNTLSFIDTQLAEISDSLAIIEGTLESLKKNNTGHIAASTAGGAAAGSLEALQAEKAAILTNDKYYKYLKSYVIKGLELEHVVIPASLGINDPILNQLISELIALQSEITVLQKNEVQSNPRLMNQIKLKQDQLAVLKSNILESLSSIKATNDIALRELDRKIASTLTELNRIPAQERKLLNVQRIFNISEGLYVFLMEKRAEAGIAKAANASDVTILSDAYVNRQIAPNSSKNYLTGLLLGLAIPLGLIFLKEFFNNKITTVEDLKVYTSIPVLGIVGHNKRDNSNLIHQSPKSGLAEAFRTVRSNLKFMVDSPTTEGKIIVITSSVSGEGKTFSAKNLAYILAISGERTLLVNADMRKPNNNTDFGVTSNIGLSNYLAGHAGLDEVIHTSLQEYLYILPAGEIPPNPSELLLNQRMHVLVQQLRSSFDYIIIDTPPVGILSDGIELMQLADASIYMVRQDYSLKSFIMSIQQQYEAGKIKNTAILFNDVDYKKLNYGYSYGYGYGYGYYAEDQEAQPWWKRLTRV
ncbi:polysaccharide biosynthesis tyrosine autokinase [Pontibacter sp. MBLB2868]|uniref:polysaccharide biosynthesis tyrosine autokinase n=1 Tax=Pontibacter sp. MBLB2868 TaxID=3451555 RepID=UPI003F7501E1